MGQSSTQEAPTVSEFLLALVMHWQDTSNLQTASATASLLQASVDGMNHQASCYARNAQALPDADHQRGAAYDMSSLARVIRKVLEGEHDSLETAADKILGDRKYASTKAAEAP